MNGIQESRKSESVQNVSQPILTEKRCPKCKIVKKREEFPKDRTKSGGLGSKCKACKRIYDLNRSGTRLSWQSMKNRCYNKNYSDYYNWGGRGIKVCTRWLKFEHFLEDMGERPDGTSLDRINNALGYEPGNCRWATPKEQARNSRANKIIVFNGEALCIAGWADKLVLNYNTLWNRINKKTPLEKALAPTP